jgi:hypothetical protein
LFNSKTLFSLLIFLTLSSKLCAQVYPISDDSIKEAKHRGIWLLLQGGIHSSNGAKYYPFTTGLFYQGGIEFTLSKWVGLEITGHHWDTFSEPSYSVNGYGLGLLLTPVKIGPYGITIGLRGAAEKLNGLEKGVASYNIPVRLSYTVNRIRFSNEYYYQNGGNFDPGGGEFMYSFYGASVAVSYDVFF